MTLNESNRFNHHKMHDLISDERESHWDPPRFLSRLGILSGQTVLDLGSGPGFWTLPLAEIVGQDGTVWALDVSQEMLDYLTQRKPPSQVRLLRAELPQIELPDSSLDLIWAAFVFHEVDPPEKLASEMRRLVNEHGMVAVLEWRPDAVGESGPPQPHRLSIEQVTQHLLEAGFKTVTLTWQDDDTYLLEAR